MTNKISLLELYHIRVSGLDYGKALALAKPSLQAVTELLSGFQ